jgi:hypothetical protein
LVAALGQLFCILALLGYCFHKYAICNFILKNGPWLGAIIIGAEIPRDGANINGACLGDVDGDVVGVAAIDLGADPFIPNGLNSFFIFLNCFLKLSSSILK